MAGKKGQKIIKPHDESPKFPEYYKKLNPSLTYEECLERVKLFNKSNNYQCIEYYEKRYPNLTHEEHLKLKEELLIQKRKNSVINIEYWKKLFPEKNLDELEILRNNAAKSKNKQNLEYWINKFPDKPLDEIKEMHNKYYQSWLSHQKGWGKGDENINSIKNTTKQIRNSRSPRNIEFYKRKYPELTLEEQENLRQEYIKKNNQSVKNTIKDTNIEYYINKGMTEEQAKNALAERQRTFTLEKCINKYGEEEGLRRFSERQQKWLKSLYNEFQSNGTGRSKQSLFAKEIIKYCCDKLNISMPKSEKYIFDNVYNRSYAYDFMFKNKIIEFQGDYWHCNPKLYKENFYNKVKQKTASEIWKYDKEKAECAQKYNYKVLHIWEMDYNQDKENILKKCIDFLLND